MKAHVFLTSQTGASAEETGELTLSSKDGDSDVSITVNLEDERQLFLGVGGSLTQASAAALKKVTEDKRAEILEAYFGKTGAQYALTRTHVGSSDFSEYSYSYANEDDPNLADFSVEEDEKNGLLDLIRQAKAIEGANFRIMASPWTAPAWMKDNSKLFDPKERRGGKLIREHYGTFARYFVKYLKAYAERGIDIWAISPVNEPQGNSGSWESMEMSAEEQRDFIAILGPQLRDAGLDTRILIFDQNRAEMSHYTKTIYSDPKVAPFTYGTAVHWYNSTFKVYEDVLDNEHTLYPDKVIIQSEGTIDSVSSDATADHPWWQNDAWFWKKEATDWGWKWAPNPEVDHPKYRPAFRYARDLVVGMGHWLSGWIDWNIVLDKQGGPNHVKNYCLAPIMVHGETNSVHYTPLYYVLKQFSRHSRPGGKVVGTIVDSKEGLHASAIKNPDGSIAVHVFNESGEDVVYDLVIDGRVATVTSPNASLQTIVVRTSTTIRP